MTPYRRVSKWMRGDVDAAPSPPYVRITVKQTHGLYRCELFLTRTQARELRERLEQIEAYYARPRS